MKRQHFIIIPVVLFIRLSLNAQDLTGDNININTTGTATSSTNYTSGTLNLTGSGWNTATNAPVPLTFQMKHIAEPFFSSLQFSLLPNPFGDPWSRTSVKFVGANMGLEVADVVWSTAARISAFENRTCLAVRNNLPWQNGIIPANSFRNMFAIGADGSVGSVKNVGYEFESVYYRNLLDDGAGNVFIGVPDPAVDPTAHATAQLHTTGSVRFAGLTANASAANVVTMDANGNLSYRDAAGIWSSSGSNIYNANAGLVVIGTMPSGFPPDDKLKLAVNGNIYAQKLKIKSDGWADYVFNPSYKLRPLKDVESFIHKNNHLPELPSAADVEKSGIDIGVNQTALLKKVEELTLYAIDQAKKQEAQQKLIKDQARMMQRLNREIETLKSKRKK